MEGGSKICLRFVDYLRKKSNCNVTRKLESSRKNYKKKYHKDIRALQNMGFDSLRIKFWASEEKLFKFNTSHIKLSWRCIH